MKNKQSCIMCNKFLLSKDEIGINKKMFGDNIKSFMCIDCLASDLDVSIQDIYDKIEEFKEQGCKLFI